MLGKLIIIITIFSSCTSIKKARSITVNSNSYCMNYSRKNKPATFCSDYINTCLQMRTNIKNKGYLITEECNRY